MAQFVLIDTHEPEECEAMFQAWEEAKAKGLHPALKDSVSLCSCMYGRHGSWTSVEAPTAEEALSYLWPLEREHATIVQVDEMPVA